MKKKDNGPTHQEYTSVRDYLLTIICINNGSRSGSLANMTLEEFQNAHQDGDDYVVKVKKHKTFTTHGPAHIVMPTAIYMWLGIFVSNFRNKLGEVDKGDNAPVFLSWNLHPVNSSHIGKQMGSCWGKVFGKEASGGGATAFRKAAVSAVQEHDEEARGNLASLMDHCKETADKFYMLQQKSKQATVAARSLMRIMHSRKCNETQAAATPHRWTAEQEKVLSDVFAEEIKEQNITLQKVEQLIKDHPVLKDFSATKIRDKVRYMYNDIVPSAMVPPQEEETSGDRLARLGILANDIGKASSTNPKRKRNAKTASCDSEYTPSLFSATKTSTSDRAGKLFDEKSTEDFKKIFSDLITTHKPIKKAVVMEIMKNSSLKHLAKNFTQLQIVDKVRTEKKKFQQGNTK
ncbi:Hypothetical predicted protein [Paramuricea clavata]|uniref:Uncharacterized protein n=1 Tax=Paramuricea clavata TaxID=317549 RepID=A0A6S7KN22_PARCT|nr:Hypothetical predicted protein [Paramuricea clavata]